jgi:hypothetical protein
MHGISAKLLPEDFGVLLFGEYEDLIVLMLPGHRVPVARKGKFALLALLTLRDLIVSTFDTRLRLKEPQPKQEADEHDELL